MMQNLAETLSPRSVSMRQHFAALVEGRRGDAGVEQDVPAQVETVGDVVGVAQDLRLRRVFLRPVPLLVELFGERERILHALDVATRAGIAVPVPGAADTPAGLIDPRGEAEPAKAVQHVHSGKAGADDDGIEGRADFRRTLRLVLRAACGLPMKRFQSRAAPLLPAASSFARDHAC